MAGKISGFYFVPQKPDVVDRYEEKKVRYDELATVIADKQAQSEIIGNFIKTIKKMDGMVECLTVFNKKKVF